MTPDTPRLTEEFVPTVDPDDLKSAWNLRHELGAEDASISRDQNASVLKPGADIDSVVYREKMLNQMFRTQSAPMCDGKPYDVYFKAFAIGKFRVGKLKQSLRGNEMMMKLIDECEKRPCQ
jgi:hypothetical protein